MRLQKSKIKLTPSALFWSMYGYFYDGLLWLYPYRHLLDRVVSKTRLDDMSRLLDLGCGTGNLSLAYLQKNPNLVIDAVDWSSSMVRQARNKLSPYSSVSVVQDDILLFLDRTPDAYYSHIAMVNVAYTISDRVRFWKQIHRVLKPGGMLIFANPDRPGNSSIIKEHVEHASWPSLFRPKLVAVWLIDGILSILGGSGAYEFTSARVLAQELTDAGFSVNEDAVERSYGGASDGIDIIMVATKR